MSVRELYIEGLIILCFLRGFLIRSNFSSLKYLWDAFVIIAPFILIYDFMKIIKANKDICIFYLIFLCTVLFSSINSFKFINNPIMNILIQFFYLNSFFVIVIASSFNRNKKSININLKTIFAFGFLQLIFDMKDYHKIFSLRLNNIQYYADSFPGTMFMANQKSRLLLVVILFLIIYFIKCNMSKSKKICFFLIMMGTIASYILGFSELTYVFLGISVSVVSMKYLLLNLYKNSRNKIRNLLIIVVFLAIVIIIIDYRFVNATNLESMIVIYRTRFINTDYGVYAVILYGLKLAVKSLFIGTGLGTFMSRGATTLGSPLLYNAPPVMVVYGQLSNVTTTVDGVSSWLILLIEGGIIAAVIFAFVIRKVISYKSNNYMVKYILSILKVYFILITLYTPYIFDSEFGYLLIIGYVTILNWLNECEKDKQVVTE